MSSAECSDNDGYQDDSLPDLHRNDSLPDLVLSSSPHTKDFLSYLNLTSSSNYSIDVPTDIEDEYFKGGDQVSATCGKEGIQVSYADHSKVYTPKFNINTDNYRSFLNLAVPDEDDSDEGSIQDQFQSLSAENQARQRVMWLEELRDTESEILELKARGMDRVRHAQLIKRKLGLTAWREFSDDMREGMKRLQESPMFQRVEETVHDTLSELTNLVISGDNMLINAVEKVEKGVDTFKELATEEIQKAHKKTSQSLLQAQRKASESLQKIGVLDPPREYRRESFDKVSESETIK